MYRFFTEQGKLLTFASLILDRTRNLNNYQTKGRRFNCWCYLIDELY